MFCAARPQGAPRQKMVSDNVAADGGAVLFVAPGVEFAGGVLGFGFVEAEHLEGAGGVGSARSLSRSFWMASVLRWPSA